MQVYFIDTKTNKIRKAKEELSVYEIIDGNWACDCNRSSSFEYFEEPAGLENICLGQERFKVYDIEDCIDLDGYKSLEDIILKANDGYK